MEMTRDMVQEILSREAYLCDGYFRVRAVEAADEEFLPRLREMFLDPNEGFHVHLAIAKALLRLGDGEFVERVAYSAEPRHPSTRVAAVRALGERYEPTPDAVQRTLHEVWKEGDMWYQDRQELKIHYLDYLRSAVQGVEDAIDVLLALVDFQHEHPRVLERVVELLLQARGRDAAPVFARAFEEVRDAHYLARIYIRAIGEAGDPSYFEVIASYPEYVRKTAPHAYSDTLAAVIGVAGRLGMYEWLKEAGKRDLYFGTHTAWLRALGEVARRQPQHREEIVAILRRYIKPRDPTRSYKINWGVVPDRYAGHPPGAKVGEPEDDSVLLHNTALEVLRELGEDVEV
jgi:hypothetical protein